MQLVLLRSPIRIPRPKIPASNGLRAINCMNNQNISLIIFAFTALAAVFAFIIILGGPEMDKVTGQVASSKFYQTTMRYYNQNPNAVTTYNLVDAQKACSRTTCRDGRSPTPTGRLDPVAGLYECYCYTTFSGDKTYTVWTSIYYK